MDAGPTSYTFRGIDGYAGFRHGQTYQLTPEVREDGMGTVMVEMPHAPHDGRVGFSEEQWHEWWEKQ
jgi:hypothetical protein